MPHNIDLILTLTGGLTAALGLGFATQKLRLSPIVGYLLAGILVGPFTPGYVANKEIATQFAEIGVILLMFGVGLHFHLKDLLAVRKIAIPGAARPDCGGYRARRGRHADVRVVLDCGPHIWNGDFRGEHGGAYTSAGRQPSPAYSHRSYCHRLVDR